MFALRHRSRAVRLAASGLLGALLVAGALVAILRPGSGPTTLVEEAASPAAMAVLPDGGLLYGERLTGRVRRVAPGGELAPDPVVEVEVATDGQRGLLGLAVDGAGTVFLSWVRPDGRLVVGRHAGGSVVPVWEGPATSELGNGGRIAFGPDGALVIGVGDLQNPDLVVDPAAPNGKLLRLNPAGPPDQVAGVISAGWNNPFAFTFTPGGALWVADNAPGSRPERIARGDAGGTPSSVTELDGKAAPSGLAAVGDDRLALCGYVSRELQLYRVDGGTARPSGAPLATDCSLGVIALPDGRLAYAGEDAIRTVGP